MDKLDAYKNMSINKCYPEIHGVHWEDNGCYISVVGSKIVTPTVEDSDILVFFLQEQFDNGLFIPNYEKSSVVPEDMRAKPFSGPIISQINKCMTGFRFNPTSDTEHYQFMRLHKTTVN